MKKGNRISLIVGALALVSMLSSCNKLLDYVNKGGGEGESVAAYRIKSIKGWSPLDSATASFTYNEKGDLVKIWFDDATTGRFNTIFRYNHEGQVTDRITTYDGRFFDSWYHYVYNNAGRVIQDTLYQLGTITDDRPTDNSTMLVSNYSYDSYGRVVKTETTVLKPNINYKFTTDYPYDIKNNLVGRADTVDTRASLYRIDPNWMLMAKDYSLNNPFVADEYNKAGLPVKLHFKDGYFFHFLHAWFPSKQVEITYE